VWICRGEVFGKRDLSPNIGLMKDKGAKTGGGEERRDNKFAGKREAAAREKTNNQLRIKRI